MTLADKMTPFSSVVHATATITATTDATTDFPGSPGTVPWSDSRIRFLSGAPQAEAAGGCSIRPTGGDNAQSNHFQFTITGTKFAVMVNAWAQADISVWVDGHPVGNVDPFLVPSGQQFVVVKGLTDAAHTVTVVLGWAAHLVQLVVASAAIVVTAGPAPAFRVAIVGDSYTDSGLAPYYAGLGREVLRLTGWAVSPLGQGSTGYTNDGSSSGDMSKSVYGSAARVAAIKAASPDLVLVEGSVNDAAALAAALRAAASAFYADIAPIPVVALGVEPLSLPGDPGTAWDVANAAILSAAYDAPNVIAVIDWRGEDWLTGTGCVSAPQGDGNQDTLIGTADGSDTIHPNLAGQKYLAGRLVTALSSVRLSAPMLTPHLDAAPCPRVEVFFPEFAPGTTTVTVHRIAAGRDFEVRGAVGASTGGTLSRIDFEAPFGIPVTYRAEQFDAAGLSLGFTDSAAITLDVIDTWMHNPLNPAGATIVTLGGVSAPSVVSPTPGVVSHPKGRMVGVVIAEPRQGVTGLPIVVRTGSDADANRVRAMVGDETTPPVVCLRLGGGDRRMRVPQPLFLSALTVEEVETSFEEHDNTLEHRFQGDEVAPPVPGLFIPLLTRRDLNEFFATRAALNASALSRSAVNRRYDLAGYGG